MSWTAGRLELALKAGFEPASPAWQAKYPGPTPPAKLFTSGNTLQKTRRGTREKSADSAPLARGTVCIGATPPLRELSTTGRSSSCTSFFVEEVTLLYHHRRNFIPISHSPSALIPDAHNSPLAATNDQTKSNLNLPEGISKDRTVFEYQSK